VASRDGNLTRILVGDVGGTHARFAQVDIPAAGTWRIHARQDLAGAFPTFEDALRRYFEQMPQAARPGTAAIAVAGPVSAGSARFTNRGWTISESELKRFGFERAVLINDFAALAFAVEILGAADLRTLGPELPGEAGATISIIGAGTGFGVSCLARYGQRAVPMATEGGHIGFAPSDADEVAVLEALWRQNERVSVERLLSGPGIETLHRTLEALAGRNAEALSAAEVVARARQGDAGCHRALTMFCSIFGTVAGDIALAHGARGGVYIAGGIAEKIEPFLLSSPFRARFESKGRLSSFVSSVPTRLIVNPDAAMLGAARAGLLLADNS